MANRKSEFIIDDEPDVDFKLIAITATLPDYLLCIELDKRFNLFFEKDESIALKTTETVILFDIFSHKCDVRKSEFCLINNKISGNFLMKNFRTSDFFLRLKGDWAFGKQKEISDFIKKINGVIAVALPENIQYKNYEPLFFELSDKDYLYKKQYVERRK